VKFLKTLPALAGAAVLLSACSDSTVAPFDPDAAVLNAIEAPGVQATGRHLVVFSSNNRVPRDFGQRVTALQGEVDVTYPGIGVAVVSGLSDDAAATLQAFDDTQHVERDVEVQWIDPIHEGIEAAAVESATEATANPAGAFFYARQWHLRAISADQAWAAGRVGSPNVKVAILDTGLSPTHPDLVGRIDAELSRSFVPFDDPFIDFYFPGMPDWVDLHYHGTHVGATVASNAVAAAGVTSGVTLIAVKVLSVNGSGSTAGVLAGLMHAADVGADVANMSLGSTFQKSLSPGFVSVINRAFTYANRQGMVVVVSAGNANLDMDADDDLYKAYCSTPLVVCTSATGPTARAGINGPWTNVDAKASYSNYGSAVTVAAPGGNGVSSVTAACSQQSLQVPVCQTGVFVIGVNGTSMASPHAAGLAALLVEDIGKNRPSQVANRMAQTADDLGEVGRDPIYGRGRINVARALGLGADGPARGRPER
jgi:lantibiotic leader peptide-processing serine protease